MKKLFFIGAVILALFLCATCANSSGGGSPAPVPPEFPYTAKMSFINGAFAAWIEGEDGEIITNGDDDDELKPLDYSWYRKEADGSGEEEIFNFGASYYIYDEAYDKDMVIEAVITYKGVECKVQSERILGTLDNAVVNCVDNCDVGDALRSEDLELTSVMSGEDVLDLSDAEVAFADIRYASEDCDDVYYARTVEKAFADDSGDYTMLVTKPGYSSFVYTKYIVVKQTLSDDEVPELSTDIENIKRGCVSFEAAEIMFDYSIVNDEWHPYEAGSEIQIPTGLTKIKVRKSAVGEIFDDGYLEESDPKVIEIFPENIGTDVSKIPPVAKMTFEDYDIVNDDMIVKVGEARGTLYFLASVNNPAYSSSDSLEFEWYLDNKSADMYNGVTAQGGTLAVESVNDLPKGCTIHIEVYARPASANGLFYYIDLTREF